VVSIIHAALTARRMVRDLARRAVHLIRNRGKS
jgi:hypothetical protein